MASSESYASRMEVLVQPLSVQRIPARNSLEGMASCPYIPGLCVVTHGYEKKKAYDFPI